VPEPDLLQAPLNGYPKIHKSHICFFFSANSQQWVDRCGFEQTGCALIEMRERWDEKRHERTAFCFRGCGTWVHVACLDANVNGRDTNVNQPDAILFGDVGSISDFSVNCTRTFQEFGCMNHRCPRIVVVGSLNMDLVLRCHLLPQRGETVMGHGAKQIPGGKGGNQATAAARLGARVCDDWLRRR
jgi:hypothetical protein